MIVGFVTQRIEPMGIIGMQSMLTPIVAYQVGCNFIYLARRSHLRNMSKRELFRIRLTREENMSKVVHLVSILTWQAFVAVFPFIEIFLRIFFQKVAFFYGYPNANGFGIILERLDKQHLVKPNQRSKHQIRFDWHRFKVNVGDIGRDGYRHPPTVELNRPHLDIPSLGMKHWPHRRRYHVETVQSRQSKKIEK